MATADDKSLPTDGKVWGLFKLPFRNSPSTTTSSSSDFVQYQQSYGHGNSVSQSQVEASGSHGNSGSSVSSVARSMLLTRRRLKLDPSNKLYFPYEPENNEKPMDQKSKGKFKIMSLKVKEPMDYVPELFGEHTDQVAVEQILRVVFLDVERPSPAFEKLKRQLAEAEAELEARKKPSEDTGPKFIGEGLVIDEWKERRERYLARQQVDGIETA